MAVLSGFFDKKINLKMRLWFFRVIYILFLFSLFFLPFLLIIFSINFKSTWKNPNTFAHFVLLEIIHHG